MKKHAVLFPGQGSQSTGMGMALAQEFEVARNVFEEVDDALQDNLSWKIWHGEPDELNLTQNAQPALMATSVAVARVLEREGYPVRKATCLAGHSLGEYSALCVAGAMSLADTARLLRIRGKAMQAAVPVGEGAMAAILGLRLDAVARIAANASQDQVCSVANVNTPIQIVVSGHREAVSRASEQSLAAGAKRVVSLKVSAPFHCRLMQPAADEMKAALADTTIGRAQVPVIANVNAQPVENPQEIRDLLVRQVTGTVRWTATLELISSMGVRTALEAGAGSVLSGTVRGTVRSIRCRSVGSPEQIRRIIGNG